MVKVKPTELKNKISVKTSVETNVFSIKDNLSEFYAKQAENWAHSEGMVNGLDYSSKYYAEQSKISAENSQKIGNIIQENYNSFMDLSSSANMELQEVKGEVIDSIGASKQDAIDSIETSKQDVINDINSTKTTILNDIEFVADGEKEEIRDIIDTGKDELKESIGDVKVLTTLEIGDIGIAPLGIDESKGKRRYLNGQLIIQEQYVQFTNKVKSAVALYPSLACTESEWQATALLTVGGQVGKFVVDDEAGTIRLPRIIMPIRGLTDLSQLAEIVQAGLPNIEGSFSSLKQRNADFRFSSTSGAFYSKGQYGTSDSILGTSGTATAQALGGFDASRSNSIYGKSGTVRPEAIQYPYFIQVATGAETEDNIINEIELNNPFFLGMSQYFETEPNNSSWLKSEGQWNAKAVYPSFYDWALINANNGIEGFKFVTDTYTDYDVVINTVDETFRLPLLNGSEVLQSDRYEELVLGASGSTYTAPANGWLCIRHVAGTAGAAVELINLTSNIRSNVIAYNGANGLSLYIPLTKGDVGQVSYGSGLTGNLVYFRFVYAQGNGSLYYYVGETVQNANLVNIGRIQEQYTTKSMVDGQWVPIVYKLITAQTAVTNAKPLVFDLSNILPNDGYDYECIFDIIAKTGTTSGNSVEIMVGTDYMFGGYRVCNAITRTNNNVSCGGSFIAIVGQQRSIQFAEASTSFTSYILLCRLQCYRRIGTNL